jgi:hypothetical protein
MKRLDTPQQSAHLFQTDSVFLLHDDVSR